MLVHVKQVLSRDELLAVRGILDQATWGAPPASAAAADPA